MRKLFFPLLLSAGLMFSGCSSFPFCCPDSVLSADITGLVAFEWDDDISNLQAIPVVSDQPFIVTVTSGWSCTINTVTNDVEVWPALDNASPAVKTGTIKILAANGDVVNVTVTQKGMPVGDFMADNADLIFDGFVDPALYGTLHVAGWNTGTTDAEVVELADFLSGANAYGYDVSGVYTQVFGNLTAAPTSVSLNGVSLTQTDVINLSIGQDLFLAFHPFIYDPVDGMVYVSTVLLMYESINGPVSLKVDAVTTVLPFVALPHGDLKIGTPSVPGGTIVSSDDYNIEVDATGILNPSINFDVVDGVGILVGDCYFYKMTMTYYDASDNINVPGTVSYGIDPFAAPAISIINQYVFPYSTLPPIDPDRQKSNAVCHIVVPGFGDSQFVFFTTR